MQQGSSKARKIVIFGNSASGKSSLAKRLAAKYQLSHLDLDTLAWLPISSSVSLPERQQLDVSNVEINAFIVQHQAWVIEGCYSDLLSHSVLHCDEIIFMDIGVEQCIANAKNRPWEPHKYASKAEQDKNLAMLIEWIIQYEQRTDTFSKAAHQKLYDEFIGQKTQYTSNQ